MSETNHQNNEVPQEAMLPMVSLGEVLSRQSIELVVDKQKIIDSSDIPNHMKDWISKLPETISFDDPVTLIVGENGSGKTQFAKSVVVAIQSNRLGSDSRSRELLLTDGEPAKNISTAISPTQPRQGNLITGVIEGANIMAKTRKWMGDWANSRGGHADKYSGSTREMFERSLESTIKTAVDDHRNRVFGHGRAKIGSRPALGGEVVYIFDEPEQGLSPQRQMELPEQVTRLFQDDDTLIVPTNNLALYLSDLPRLDVGQPERGVFRPSEYGETASIQFLHS